MTTTARQDLVAGTMGVLVAFRIAHPTLLHGIYSARPGSFDPPAAFLGPRDEAIVHTSGTRQRTFGGFTVVLVDAFGDNEQTVDRLDVLVDGLVDAFTAAKLQFSGGRLQMTAVIDGELDQGGPEAVNRYRAVTLLFGETVVMEGRS